jgi:hypothetical protein
MFFVLKSLISWTPLDLEAGQRIPSQAGQLKIPFSP